MDRILSDHKHGGTRERFRCARRLRGRQFDSAWLHQAVPANRRSRPPSMLTTAFCSRVEKRTSRWTWERLCSANWKSSERPSTSPITPCGTRSPRGWKNEGHSEFERGLVLNHSGSGVTAGYSHGYGMDLKLALLSKWANHIEALVQPEQRALLR